MGSLLFTPQRLLLAPPNAHRPNSLHLPILVLPLCTSEHTRCRLQPAAGTSPTLSSLFWESQASLSRVLQTFGGDRAETIFFLLFFLASAPKGEGFVPRCLCPSAPLLVPNGLTETRALLRSPGGMPPSLPVYPPTETQTLSQNHPSGRCLLAKKPSLVQLEPLAGRVHTLLPRHRFGGRWQGGQMGL